MQRFTRLLSRPLAIAVLAGAFFVSAADAQTSPPSPKPPDQSAEIPDQKLDAAAAAFKQVANLKEDYQKRIAVAQPSDKERIADEGNQAFEKAVTDQGLSVEEYTSILVVAQADQKVREKILQRLGPSSN
ncbi:MAG: DUF4168 domain-containing protein [Xanthobacteraceae bacterium]